MIEPKKKPNAISKSCLICKKTAKTLRKGLCPSHYAQYVRSRELAIAKGLDADQFDADLISQGLLAEDARQANNPFASALAKFEAKMHVAEAREELEQRRKTQ